MCYVDLEPCEVWTEWEVKARKSHLCDCCRGVISKGQTYTRHFSKFDGEISSEKICHNCDVERSEFAKMHEHTTPSPSNTKDLIDECLHERESFRDMLKWARALRKMDARRSMLLPIRV